MKIGILTFHNAYNYGAVLQAYALQKFIEGKGFCVEIIDYRNAEVEQSYKLFRFRLAPKRNIIKFLKYYMTQSYRCVKFMFFHKSVVKILKISPKVTCFKDSSIAEKDVIIIGSDQLWNRKITRINDPFYWGEFSNYVKGKVTTYAICMNTDNLSDEDVGFIKQHLRNFDSLSVRETELANMLKPLTSKHISISLDPTMMVDSSLWYEMIKNEPEPIKEPYILVYAILERKKVIEAAHNFANRRNMRLVIMNPIADASPFKGYYQPNSPSGFVSAISHAEYVITSSFHGLAFSIIFHREVYVMGDSGQNERMHSILNSLGIGERFFDSLNDLEIDEIEPIDYNSVEVKLELLRSHSKGYLNKIMN